jgi:Bacterial Ig-like domain/L,D-transpeptidase catalytic domain
VGVAAAAVVAAGVTYAITQSSSSSGPSAVAPLGQQAAGPMRFESISPTSRSTGVDGAAPIIITFSAPVAADSPDPVLQPSVAGSWSAEGDSMVFTPSQPFAPNTKVTVEIPAGPAGVRSEGGGLLTSSLTDAFTTGGYTQLALAELLAQQGYLPMTWSAIANGATRAEAANALSEDPASETAAGEAYDPPAGTFSFTAGYPSTLARLWTPDQANPLLRGAVMAFESEHHMTVSGNLTPQLWKALFQAQQLGQLNHNGYTYAIADQEVPETLTIWHNGHVVLRSLANTGIPDSPTDNGTFPVYEKFLFQIMRGVNPDGSAYADPVQYVSYFNGGDAVHYFPRGAYGFQQSLGCVELPWTAAQRAYPYLTYGSLVTVTG